jgi:transcriptional regulator with XRE-family HTH domain
VWINPNEHKLVGGCLANLRTDAGVTQVELAKRLKKPQSFVSSYEGGQRRIDLLELARIAAALRADPRSICVQIFDALNTQKKAPGRRRRA